MPRKLVVLLLVLAAAAAAWFLWPNGPDLPEGARAHTIVLLTPDTLRWDHVSAYAPKASLPTHPETPRLDALARRGVRFVDARSPVPLTLPAHVTMLSALSPAETGVRLNTYGRLAARAERGYALLQEALQTGGYHTAAFVSAAVLGRRYGLDQGFHHYDDGGLRVGSRATVAERPGRATVAAALAHVRSRPADEPLFLWVHLFEPHAPYAKDGTYAGDVIDLDEIVGDFLDGLAAAGRGDAAVLMTSDHGEALGELGERTHGMLLGEAVLRVPFVLAAPDLEPGVRTDPVELADVGPTLAAMGGSVARRAFAAGRAAETEPAPGRGRDLLAGPAPAGRIRVAESLYGHHLHGWAQLSSAIGHGGTLADVGRDRLVWLPSPGHQRLLEIPATLPDAPWVRTLADTIARYKRLEQPGRMRAGPTAATYYGHGAPPEGFLSAEENAKRPDPYAAMPFQLALDQVKARLLSRSLTPAMAQAALGRIAHLAGQGALSESPELAFWQGEAHKRAAELGLGISHLADAEAAYLRAFELGRKDTQTLVRACGVNAGEREAECLQRLEDLGRQLAAPGCQYHRLRRRLLEKVPDRTGEIEAARAAEERACGAPGER